jgi:hypothetical protein
MQELKKKLTNLGLSEEMATQAMHLMAEYLKSKVPPPYQGMVDQVLSGESTDLSAFSGGMMDKMKGLFGGN